MPARTSLDTYLRVLLSGAVIVPLALVAVAAGFLGSRELLLVIVGIAAVGIALAVLLARSLAARWHDGTEQPAPSAESAKDERIPSRRSPSAKARRAAHARANRSVRASRLARELARAGLATHARATAARERLEDREGEIGRQLADIAEDAARLYRQSGSVLAAVRSQPIAEEDIFEPGHALELAVDMLRPRLQRLDIPVRVASSAPVPSCVGDILTMQAVFVHVIDSAWQALARSADARRSTREDTAVLVDLRGAPGGLSVQMTVTAKGADWPGDAERAFDPELVVAGDARGARLALCRHLLTRVGGTLEVRDGEGERAPAAVLVIPSVR